MDLNLLSILTERLRAESIGDPEWVESKGVFEYSTQSVEVVTVLKVVRAAQGIHALDLLCRSGLFIDMYTIYRCIDDCNSEVYFLLENYPTQSSDVQRFVKAFFATTIDSDLSAKTEYVLTKKIHSAVARVITGMEQHESTRARVLRVYKTFCGYTHAHYSNIMEIYGGTYPDLSFNVAGVPSLYERDKHMKTVEQAYLSVLYSLAFIAQKLKLNSVFMEIWSHHESLNV
jgi:hypothetical protein